jgi:selenocysteine lyase/cysteine desulfurase
MRARERGLPDGAYPRGKRIDVGKGAVQGEAMDIEPLGGAEFAPKTAYLNTSACGLLPRRAVEAVKQLAEDNATGRGGRGSGDWGAVEAARASFARVVGVSAERVAVGSSVSEHAALVAASLPPGAEVVVPEAEFSSVVSPFAARGDLVLREVPLAGLAEAVRPGTALVAFSAVQSADGRIADLGAVRDAAAAHGARTLMDASQAAGWLLLRAGAYDYTVTGGFKYLMGPRGTSFLTVTQEAQESLTPRAANLLSAEDTENSIYGSVPEFARAARRFDTAVSFLSYHGAEQSLAVLLEVGVEAAHTHAVGLADRFRKGLLSLGHAPLTGPASDGSAIVAAPGLGARRPALTAAGVDTTARGGILRASFHLYNATADVDRALDVLAG